MATATAAATGGRCEAARPMRRPPRWHSRSAAQLAVSALVLAVLGSCIQRDGGGGGGSRQPRWPLSSSGPQSRQGCDTPLHETRGVVAARASLFCSGLLYALGQRNGRARAMAATKGSTPKAPRKKRNPGRTREQKKELKKKQKLEQDLGPEDEYEAEPIPESELVPVTIVTGFLGAGKTTLVNYILREKHGRKIAVVENEFGEVSIDDALVADQLSTNETIITMDNGCVCCQLRGDLQEGFRNLALSGKEFEAVLLETTGLADPVPVAFTFQQPPLNLVYRIDGIVTLVDASHALPHLREKPSNGSVNAAVRQIAFSDRIVLNKLDLVSEESLKEVVREIRSINKFAPIIKTNRSVVPLERILNISSFSIENAFEIDPSLVEEFNATTAETNCTKDCDHDDHDHHHHHGHDHGHHKHNGSGLASKHDLSSVGSYGFEFEGEMTMERLNHFMTSLLQQRSEDLFRSKGVFSLVGSPPMKFVFQGVHEQIQLGPASRQWQEGEPRTNKFVFIGRNLPPREYMLRKLKECVVKNSFAEGPFPTYDPSHTLT